MRVVHVIDNLSLGGTQRLMADTLKELSRRKIDVRLCVLGSSSQTFAGHALPVKPVYMRFSGEYRNPMAIAGWVQRLRATLREEKPAIVHSYLWLSDLMAALAVRGTGVRHVSHIVDRRNWLASRKLRHRLRRWQTKRAFRKAGTRFLAVSAAAREFACTHLGLEPGHVRIAYNSIDLSPFLANGEVDAPAADRLPVLGTAGRLAEEKGHVYLLEAAAQLRRSGRRFRLLITGDGPLRPALQGLADKLGLGETAEFVGQVPDIAEFYRRLDVFVVPSIFAEGLPTTILEAMASQKPVVVTDVGGASEAVRHGIEGLVVPARDSDALARAIEQVLDATDDAFSMATAARRRVQEVFTLERMVDVVLQGYEDLLGGKWNFR